MSGRHTPILIDLTAQADPMPTALIWGALKVVIDGSDRCLQLFETINDQIKRLRVHIEDATAYEDLYGESPQLQQALFDFYSMMLKFWCRVDKECNRSSRLTSFSQIRPDKILGISQV